MPDAVTEPDCYRTACTSIRACIILCQQLERLGSRGSYWVSEPGCCRDEPCTCTQANIYFIYLLVMSTLFSQDEAAGGPCICAGTLCMSAVGPAVCIYVFMWCMCTPCVHLLGDTSSDLLLVGGDMELHQPCLSGSKIMAGTISSSTAQNSLGRREDFFHVTA